MLLQLKLFIVNRSGLRLLVHYIASIHYSECHVTYITHVRQWPLLFPTTIKRTPNYCSIILSSKWWRLTCLRYFWMTSSTRLRNALKIFTSSTTSPNSGPCWYKNFKTVSIDVLVVLLLIVSNFSTVSASVRIVQLFSSSTWT